MIGVKMTGLSDILLHTCLFICFTKISFVLSSQTSPLWTVFNVLGEIQPPAAKRLQTVRLTDLKVNNSNVSHNKLQYY